ncbi:TDP-N-acetylfucosamine:lipid II N-acetylfucosaminyltransferase [Pseudofulvibacter geojedonensis]|uniref:TDP-N-acetylfucosamine:lipid II N-acetylfucosaminyltransferase n=1 Tax=Pseudofulvibacter geojedonensis TaxID=1123758 RepID=A0ABW3HYQ0_9FLAO
MVNRVIHIAEDRIFIDSAIRQFEKVMPRKNVFYVFTDDGENKIKRIKNINEVIVNSPEVEIFSTIKSSDLVIFHSLVPRFYNLVINLPKEVKCVWLCFGFEVYNDKRLFPDKMLYDQITFGKYGQKRREFKTRFKEWSRPYYRLLKKKLPYSEYELKKLAMERIDYLGSSFKNEYEYIQKIIGYKKKFFPFWYYPLEEIINVNDLAVEADKTNILIGHSGVPYANHIDTFKKLENCNSYFKEIVAPLSYGDNHYIKEILEFGERLFGEKFSPLTSFLALDEYNSIIKKCKVVVFNNRRQQAVGNTIALIWMGAKVFLSKKNTFYHFLKEKGVNVYCYENDFNEQNIKNQLQTIEIDHNRNVLLGILSSSVLEEELKTVISTIN